MTLRERRVIFTRLLCELILWAFDQGWEVAVDEVRRGPAQVAWNVAHGVGVKMTLHALGLAGDLLLYIDGKYQTDSEAYRPLGEKWESLGGSWGGRFAKPDGNHFSLEYNGVR